ncbi:MAG: pseudouridine synthase [Lachnospiraceae bacterium]|nr:pseudouridine synthase [Lachnospiraceae bacterium]
MENRNDGVRLNKYIGSIGICSRREADRLIEEGKVTIIHEDGSREIARAGFRYMDGDRIEIDGKAVEKTEDEKLYMMLNKPKGIICTGDRRVKENIIDFAGLRHYISYAGRLDKDSTGLVILTNDGELNDRIMRASNYHEKEYVVTVDKYITPDFLAAMRSGVTITLDDNRNLTGEIGSDGKPLGKTVTTRPCKVWKTGKREFRIILTQGFNRQIRRMCGKLGYTVQGIRRVRVMNLELGSLKEGMKRFLTPAEVARLKEMAGMLKIGN